MQIFVKLPSGRTITLYTEPNDTIREVKKGVMDKEGFPCGHFFDLQGRLINKILEEDKTLLYYGIQKEERLYLRLNVCRKIILKIFYNFHILNLTECYYCCSHTCLYIKNMIKEQFKVDENKIIIIYKDKILKDDINLKNIEKSNSNSFLELFIVKKGFSLFKIINGEDIIATCCINRNNYKKQKKYSDIKKK